MTKLRERVTVERRENPVVQGAKYGVTGCAGCATFAILALLVLLVLFGHH